MGIHFLLEALILAAVTSHALAFLNKRHPFAFRKQSLKLDVTERLLDAVVVGSGITGSTAAYYMHKENCDIILAEAQDKVGGNVISKSGMLF
jgi:NADPH-dependent 2,4-dienoyl-CoA reductase/sulfur reductase-like enzyme